MTRARILSIIGTAADHLQSTEAKLSAARAAHAPTKKLQSRRVLLKARCAALSKREKRT